MKIGILTFHASHNYGSMLQAWALQHYLNSHGHEAETINLRIKAQRDMYHFPLRPGSDSLKTYVLSLLNPFWMFHACRKWYNYENFLRNNLRLTKKIYKSWEEIRKDLPILGYDCLITGGDQLWNMNCRDFSESYYLPSKLENVRKVSYSPSFGGIFLSKKTHDQELFIKKHLSDYNYISVRETSMVKYLSRLLEDKIISIALDPTILLNAKDYDEFLTSKPLVDGEYIYYYTPRNNPKAEIIAKLIGEHYGIKVVTSFPHVLGNKGMSLFPEAGPAEFLNLLKNARMVIGKSFHLVVFSLLFHKDFIAIDGYKDARMKSILDMLHIPERGMVNEENYKTVLPSIDYCFIDRIISDMRKSSEIFLEKAFS